MGALIYLTPEEWEKSEPDAWELAAQEIGVPANYRWDSLKVIGDKKAPRHLSYVEATLIPPPDVVFKSGRKKGQYQFAKRDKSRDRTVILSMAAADRFQETLKGA